MQKESVRPLNQVVPPDRRSDGVIATTAAALECMRPYQWLKNTLVFVPLVAAHRLDELDRLRAAFAVFLAFSFCASAIYLINDIKDVAADRLHPHKRFRPIASGRLPRSIAFALTPLLLAAGMAIATSVDSRVTVVLAIYVVIMVVYSLWLKSLVLLDALVLAGGYAMRIAAGAVAVAIRPPPELLAFFVFVFFSLAMVKRYAELSLLRLAGVKTAPSRSYGVEDSPVIMVLGGSSGILSVLVLALVLTSDDVDQTYTRTTLGWCAAVLLLYWISHMWLVAHRGRMTDDPLVFAIKDRVSVILIALTAATAWFAV
jgi:4-hydroxybenzoate polyprenyltransferase